MVLSRWMVSPSQPLHPPIACFCAMQCRILNFTVFCETWWYLMFSDVLHSAIYRASWKQHALCCSQILVLLSWHDSERICLYCYHRSFAESKEDGFRSWARIKAGLYRHHDRGEDTEADQDDGSHVVKKTQRQEMGSNLRLAWLAKLYMIGCVSKVVNSLAHKQSQPISTEV